MIDLSKFNTNDQEYQDLVSLYGLERVEREFNLELESQQLAQKEFINRLYKSRENDRAASTGTTRTLMTECVPIVAKYIEKAIAESDTGKPGRRNAAITAVKAMDKLKCAVILCNSVLSTVVGHKGQAISLVVLCKEISKDIEAELRFSKLLSSVSTKERRKLEHSLSTRKGDLYRHAFLRFAEKSMVEEGLVEGWKPWDEKKKIQVGMKLLEIFLEATDLGYLYKQVSTTSKKLQYLFSIRPEIIQYIDFNDRELASLCFKNRPMVIPPKKWTKPIGGGYYLNLKRVIPLVRIPLKEVNELYADVDMPNVYNAVNAIQNTPWRINQKVLKVAQEVCSWKVIPECLDMPSAEYGEPPIRMPECDTNPEAQRAWRKDMVRYYRLENARKGKRLLVNAILALTAEYKDDQEIYFPHNLDFRGRIYPLTILSPQSNDFGKSLIEFAHGVPVGDQRGADWLAFHGANCYGLDKKPMDERIAWVYSNTELIARIAENPLDNQEWMAADSPWEFLAFCFEWDEYRKQGYSYESHIAVAFDGSCSGLQHFSAMLRDEVGGYAVNLVPDTKVHDIYQIVADKVKERLKEDLAKGEVDEIISKDGEDYLKKGVSSMAKEWLDYGISRSVTKRCTMTLPYGAKKYGFADQILEDTVNPANAHNPLAFSKPMQSSRYMAGLIWDSLSQVVVKAVEAMSWLQDASALLASDVDMNGNHIPTFWITPAGFPVRQKYLKLQMTQVDCVLLKGIRIKTPDGDEETAQRIAPSVGIVSKDNEISTRKQRQGIAPNFVHSMDASHMMLTVLKGVEQGLTGFACIHDSYGTHAGNADKLFHIVREVFVDTYEQNDVLQSLYDAVAHQLSPKLLEKLPKLPERGTLDLEEVKNSLYCFS